MEDCEQEMHKKESERDPAEPVMEWGEGNLPLHENVPVVLFDERGNDEKKEKDTAQDTRPPNEVITEDGGWKLP